MNSEQTKPQTQGNTEAANGWVFQASKGERWCNGQEYNYYVSAYNMITQQIAPMCSIRARSQEQAIQQFHLQLPSTDL